MASPTLPSLPFLTRDMLSWQEGVIFDIEVNSYGLAAVEFKLIGATREGMFAYNFTPNGTGGEQSFFFGIPDIPIFLTTFTDSPQVELGEEYATIYLRANKTRILKLAAGFISKQAGIGYPLTESKTELSDSRASTTITGTVPATGAEINDNISGNRALMVSCIKFRFTTDANVANRRVHLTFRPDASNKVFDIFGDQDQAAGTTRDYIFAKFGAIPDTLDNSITLCPLPEGVYIGSASSIQTETLNLQAGDAFTSIFYYGMMGFED